MPQRKLRWISSPQVVKTRWNYDLTRRWRVDVLDEGETR
jgi:hypothetical protein